MRKTWSLCWALLLPGVAAAQPPPQVAPALPAPSALEIDGDLSEWIGQPYIPLCASQQAAYDQAWGGRDDLSAKIYLAWTPRALILAAEVADRNLQTGQTGADARNDSLDFVVQTPTRRRAPRIHHLLISPNGGDWGDCTIIEGQHLGGFAGARGRSHKWGEKHAYEVAVRWSALGVRGAAEGLRLGLAFRLNDYDDGDRKERGHLHWGWPFAMSEAEARRAGQKPYGGDFLGADVPVVEPEPAREAPQPPPPPEGQLELVQELARERWPELLPALLALRDYQTYYTSNQDAYLSVLSGVPLWIGPLSARLRLTDPAGNAVFDGDVRRWRWGRWRGWEHKWRTPDPAEGEYRGQFRVTDPAGRVVWSRTWRIRCLGRTYQPLRDRLNQYRSQVDALRKLPYDPEHAAVTSRALSLWRRLDQFTRWVDDFNKRQIRPEPDVLREQLAQVEQAVRALRDGRDPLADCRGLLVKSYRSQLDDSEQPYSIWVPDSYHPDTPHPLVITLHGFGGGFSRSPPRPEIRECLVLSAQGRGNTDYKVWGELDVLRALAEVRRDYNVDANRICLTGESMGGTGTWQLGVHHPDLFAALGPVMGNADHRVWEKWWQWGDREPTPYEDLKEFMERAEDAEAFAANLLHVPSFCVHGSNDDVVPVDHSRSIVRTLRARGCPVIYCEEPGKGHGGFRGETYTQLFDYLLSQRRDPYPKHVVLRAAWLRHAKAYWLQIERFQRWLQCAQLNANIRGQQVEVRADNVARYALLLNDKLLDTRRPVEVLTNGQLSFRGMLPADGKVVIRLPGHPKDVRGIEKRAGLEGPIEDAFLSRFLIVYGQSGEDEDAKRVNEEEARRIAEHWKQWAQGDARMKPDYELTQQDIEDSNLILIGNPASNAVVASVNDKLPVRFDGEAVVVGRRRFAGPDLGIKVGYPNPLNPHRYVAVLGGTTWRGTHEIAGRFGNWFDWGVLANRNWFDYAVFDDRTFSAETFVVVGFFDQDWRLAEELMWAGDDKLRSAAIIRDIPLRQLAADDGVVYLSDLRPKRSRIERGAIGVNRSFTGRPLKLGDRAYEKGLGVRPFAEVFYEIAGRFRLLECEVGLDLEGQETVSEARAQADKQVFQIFGDGRLLADSGEMRWDTPPRRLLADISGVREVRLVTDRRTGKPWLSGSSIWGEPRLLQPIPARPALASGAVGDDLAETLSLDGEWRLESAPIGSGFAEGHHLADPAATSEGIVPSGPPDHLLRAQVPGTVQAAVAAAGLEPDPYVGKNADRYAELLKREWWYSRGFRVPADWRGRAVRLQLDGFSYAAHVFVNGEYVARGEGMFLPASADVTPYVRYGEDNSLAIRICANSWELGSGGDGKPPERKRALACQMLYGWDFAPRLFPIGLWRGVRLRTTGPARLAHPRVRLAEHTDRSAELAITVEVTSHLPNTSLLRIRGTIEPPGGGPASPISTRLFLGPDQSRTATIRATLRDPRLWWPHGLGPQDRYRLRLELTLPSGAIADQAETSFGVRDIRPLLPPGQDQVSPLSVAWSVNGVEGWRPLGLRWVPCDALLRLDRERYRRLLVSARQSGVNLLHAWGGGLIETDEFYDLCDELGILVVQDFPLASSNYKDMDRGRFTNAAREAIWRLRNRPSLAAWRLGDDLDPDHGDNKGLMNDLRKVCAELDSDRALFRPLPRGGGDPTRAPWISKAPPATHNLPLFLPRDRLWPPDDYWQAHGLKADTLEGVRDHRGAEPRTLEDLRAWLDDEQYLACRAWLDDCRGQGAPNPGWGFHLADPWPCHSSSLLDWRGDRKPAFQALLDGAGPVIIEATVPTHALLAGQEVEIAASVTNVTTDDLGEVILSAEIVAGDGATPLPSRTAVLGPLASAQGLHFVWHVPAAGADPSPVLRLRARAGGRDLGSAAHALCVLVGDDSDVLCRALWLTRRPASDLRRACELRRLGVAASVVDLSDTGGVRAALADAPNAYDVVIVSPEAKLPMPRGVGNDLARLAERGVGLVLDGYVQHWRGTPVGPLCPLRASTYLVVDGDQGLRWPDAQAPLVWGLDAGKAPKLKWAPLAAPATQASVLAYTEEGLPVLATTTSTSAQVSAFSLPVLSLRAPQWDGWQDYQAFAAGAVILAAGGGAAQLVAVRQAPPALARNAKAVREALR